MTENKTILCRINPDRIRLVLGDHDRRHHEAHQQQRLIEKVFFVSYGDNDKYNFNTISSLTYDDKDQGHDDLNNKVLQLLCCCLSS